jgi:hypothetical protein
VTRQKHAAEEEATTSLDERRTMYFGAAADNTRIDAALGELRLLPTLEPVHGTEALEQQLRVIVQEMTHDGES